MTQKLSDKIFEETGTLPSWDGSNRHINTKTNDDHFI